MCTCNTFSSHNQQSNTGSYQLKNSIKKVKTSLRRAGPLAWLCVKSKDSVQGRENKMPFFCCSLPHCPAMPAPGDRQNRCFLGCLRITDNRDHWGTTLKLTRIYRRGEESFSKCLFLKSPLVHLSFPDQARGQTQPSTLFQVEHLYLWLHYESIYATLQWVRGTRVEICWGTQKGKRCEKKLYRIQGKYFSSSKCCLSKNQQLIADSSQGDSKERHVSTSGGAGQVLYVGCQQLLLGSVFLTGRFQFESCMENITVRIWETTMDFWISLALSVNTSSLLST